MRSKASSSAHAAIGGAGSPTSTVKLASLAAGPRIPFAWRNSSSASSRTAMLYGPVPPFPQHSEGRACGASVTTHSSLPASASSAASRSVASPACPASNTARTRWVARGGCAQIDLLADAWLAPSDTDSPTLYNVSAKLSPRPAERASLAWTASGVSGRSSRHRSPCTPRPAPASAPSEGRSAARDCKGA